MKTRQCFSRRRRTHLQPIGNADRTNPISSPGVPGDADSEIPRLDDLKNAIEQTAIDPEVIASVSIGPMYRTLSTAGLPEQRS